MLEKLDSIPWRSLHHAYGTAEDVPDLLRSLAHSDKWNDAIGELYGNIYHQGTVYEASAYAVPFLFELVVDSSIAWRGDILGLIGELADGTSYLDVHARTDGIGVFWRKKPGFEENLAKEKADVSRTRDAVLQHIQIVLHQLNDTEPNARAAAAYVVSRFPEHAPEFSHHLRQAANRELHPLARAAMLFCLGQVRDTSQETVQLLERTLHDFSDLRQAFAAATALCQIRGEVPVAALPICRQMAAAIWFAESFLTGVSFNFSAHIELEELLINVAPDPSTASQSLLDFLDRARDDEYLCTCIMHDLLALNFDGGKWRECRGLTEVQSRIFSSLVERDYMWRDTKRLFFLFPDGGQKISKLQPSDIQKARQEMASLLEKSYPKP